MLVRFCSILTVTTGFGLAPARNGGREISEHWIGASPGRYEVLERGLFTLFMGLVLQVSEIFLDRLIDLLPFLLKLLNLFPNF